MVSGTAIETAERISIRNNEFIIEMKYGISRIYDLAPNFLLFIRVIWRYFAYFLTRFSKVQIFKIVKLSEQKVRSK